MAEGQVKEIAKILLKNLSDRLEKQINVTLNWTENAVDELAKQGFDPNFGARPLRRLLTHTVETELSKKIIANDIKEGDSVEIDFADGKFTFNAKVSLDK